MRAYDSFREVHCELMFHMKDQDGGIVQRRYEEGRKLIIFKRVLMRWAGLAKRAWI